MFIQYTDSVRFIVISLPIFLLTCPFKLPCRQIGFCLVAAYCSAGRYRRLYKKPFRNRAVEIKALPESQHSARYSTLHTGLVSLRKLILSLHYRGQ